MSRKATPAQLFAKLFAVFIDASAPPGERASAERKMDQWLARHSKTRRDIPTVLVQAAADDAAAAPPPPPSDPRDTDPAHSFPNVTVLDLMRAMAEDYLALTPHEYVAFALWTVHTHVF